MLGTGCGELSSVVRITIRLVKSFLEASRKYRMYFVSIINLFRSDNEDFTVTPFRFCPKENGHVSLWYRTFQHVS